MNLLKKKPYEMFHYETIEECVQRKDKMNDWEKSFVCNLQQQILANKAVNMNQLDKVSDIHSKLFS